VRQQLADMQAELARLQSSRSEPATTKKKSKAKKRGKKKANKKGSSKR